MRQQLCVCAAIALLGFSPGVCSAGFITYAITDHPDLQNGYHISGEITTDGTIGPLTAVHILSWQFTITGPSGARYQAASTTDGAKVFTPAVNEELLTASLTSITMQRGGSARFDLFILASSSDGGDVSYGVFSTSVPDVATAGDINTERLWLGRDPGPQFEVASVTNSAIPEPGTLTLALVGLGGLFGASLMRRRRETAPGPSV